MASGTTGGIARLVKESGGYAGIEVTQQGIALLTIGILLAWLSPADFGTVTLALVVTQIAMTAATLGLEFTVLRSYFQWPDDRRAGALSGALTGACLWSAVLAAGGWLMAAWVDDALRLPLLWAWWCGLFLGVRGIPLSSARANGWLRSYAVVVVGGSLVQSLLQLVFVSRGFGAAGFVGGQLAGAAISTVVSIVISRGVLGRPHLEAGVLSYTLAILPSSLASRLLLVADRLVLAQLVPLDALGAYGLASRLAQPVKMVGGIFRMALAPALSRAERGGNLDTVFALSTRLILGATLAMAGFIALGAQLLHVSPWSSVAADVIALLGILLWAQALAAMQGAATMRIYYSHQPGASAWVTGVGAGVLLAALWGLAPTWGGTGAALAQLLSALTGMAVAMTVGARWTSDREQWAKATALALSFGIAAFAAVFLGTIAQTMTLTLLLVLYGSVLVSAFFARTGEAAAA